VAGGAQQHRSSVVSQGSGTLTPIACSQSSDQWTDTVRVKAAGARNLDIATRGEPVDAFVVFSTLMSYRGMQGTPYPICLLESQDPANGEVFCTCRFTSNFDTRLPVNSCMITTFEDLNIVGLLTCSS
jgi:hypothetical protein